MMIKMLIIAVLCVLVSFGRAHVEILDLSGMAWSASGTIPPSNIIVHLPQTKVPGCVHLDWMRGKNITEDLYYRFNDDKLKWIPESNWVYQRSFESSTSLLSTYEHWLVFEGLDTIATISFNGKKLGTTSDMFQVHRYNVSSLLQQNFNLIVIEFESALIYTNNQSSHLPYPIPPNCPPSVQHGYCHVNLIRKEQCSFSWDWGPAYATMGIWKPAYVLSLNYAVITEATAIYNWDASSLEVDLQFLLVMFADQSPLYGNVSISIEELNVHKHFEHVELPRMETELTDKKFIIDFKNIKFERWWPNGYGKQKLYNVSVVFSSFRGDDVSQKNFLFGFRKVELVQEPLPNTDGLSFYFRINDLPVFAKGANWIPADAFKARITFDEYERLLQSAADAHMNMMRVWGGGIYEDKHFYETADKLGIMLWQDFMFACALYPSTGQFLANVTKEISNVMWKLKHHPSIVLWAGNNENEAALATDWWGVKDEFKRYEHDYVRLYIDAIGKEITSLDNSRPFVSSSPSNGKETTAEGGVAKNPYDSHYGDVHYYNYDDDCLDWNTYPPTRFSSEYGFQSWPSFETIRPVTIDEDWSLDSKWAEHRQHHPDGNKVMVTQIAKHFQVPSDQDKFKYFLDIIYLSQIMQGLCYKSQTEFYRRSRNETVKGAGHTMGALYWQLNDIWQAPTWSSIEYGGKWKALHYFAVQFFAPVAVIAHEDDASLVVYSASDVGNDISGTLVIQVWTWDSFDPSGEFNQSITIPAHRSTKIFKESTGIILQNGGCPYKEVCYISIHVKESPFIPTNFFFPVPFKNIEHLHQTTLKIANVTKVKNGEFYVTITSTKPALFVWLEAVGIKGRFSENAFVMNLATKRVKFYSWQSGVTSGQVKASLSIRCVNNMLSSPEDPTELSRTVEDTSTLSWLDDDSFKLFFALGGLMLVFLTSAQVICLVLRLNKPNHRPKSDAARFHDLQKQNKFRSMSSLSSDPSSLSSGMSSYSDEATGFLIHSQRGKGENSKKTEYRFYII